MSLINEALKKAQGQRPSGDPAQSAAAQPPQPPTPPQPPRHSHQRSFFRGFLMAVLVVGIFTTLLGVYFVRLILGPDEAAEKGLPVAAQLAEPTPLAPVPPIPAPIPAAPETASTVAGSAAPAPAPEQAAAPAPEQAAAPPPVAATTAAAPVAPATEPAPPAAPAPAPEPAPAPDPEQPDQTVLLRLMDIEIRGIMSGGARVLG